VNDIEVMLLQELSEAPPAQVFLQVLHGETPDRNAGILQGAERAKARRIIPAAYIKSCPHLMAELFEPHGKPHHLYGAAGPDLIVAGDV
jgi:hypothetical protein